MNINIAIDGPSAAGKSTIAKILAKELGYVHLDTGAMYRCVAYLANKQNVAADDAKSLVNIIDTMDMKFHSNGEIELNGRIVTNEIRENNISMLASKVSMLSNVREKLVTKQKNLAKEKGYILDGRDIGTVVLPNAELKIYMVASVEARAMRRFQEYKNKGIVAEYEEIFNDIKQRDYQDMNREHSPLKKSKDAYEIDTSNMSVEEVVTKIHSLIHNYT